MLISDPRVILIHIYLKVESRIESPTHTEYLSSGVPMILIFALLEAMAVVTFYIWSPMPGYITVLPDSTMVAHRFF